MNRLLQTKLTRQQPDSNPNATRGLVDSSPTEPSGHASGRVTSRKGTSGGGTSGRGTTGRGTSRRGTSGRLSPPAYWPSSCCSTSTSEVFPAASAILERFIEHQHHHARSCKNTTCAMSHNTVNKWKIISQQSKNLATRVLINASDK